MTINDIVFDIELNTVPELETFSVNNKEYTKVYRIDAPTSNTLTTSVNQVLYNTAVGIIQITLEDNAKVSLL